MSDSLPVPAAPGRWNRPIYLLLIIGAVAMVFSAWFHTPVVHQDSDTAEGGYSEIRCANAGPSRWDPPTVGRGQDLDGNPSMQTFNQMVLKNDIESLRVDMACDQARDAHTNTLIVTGFGAAAILFFGYTALWKRRPDAAPAAPAASDGPDASDASDPSAPEAVPTGS